MNVLLRMSTKILEQGLLVQAALQTSLCNEGIKILTAEMLCKAALTVQSAFSNCVLNVGIRVWRGTEKVSKLG